MKVLILGRVNIGRVLAHKLSKGPEYPILIGKDIDKEVKSERGLVIDNISDLILNNKLKR
jgi:hypothetical protein